MLGCALPIPEEARGFDNDVHPQVPPHEVGWVALAEQLDLFTIHHQTVFRDLHRAGEDPVIGVVLEKVSHRGQITNIIDGYYLQLVGVVVEHSLEGLSPNSPEPVDSNLSTHSNILLKKRD